MINKDKWEKLAAWMEKLYINEDALIENLLQAVVKADKSYIKQLLRSTWNIFRPALR